jgi:hypothetical protein
MDKKCIFVILVIITLVFSACFSSWKGDEGTLSIRIGSENDQAADRAAFGLTKTDSDRLEHTITLSYGLGLEQIQKNVKYGETVTFSVMPGRWTITITAYLDGEIYAEGSRDVEVKPGPNGAITITMKLVKQVEPSKPEPIEPPTPPEPPVEPVEPPESATYTVTFMVGDIPVYSTSVSDGTTISAFEVLYINSLIDDIDDFLGWYTDPVEGEKWNLEETPVNKNITLYARWNEPEGIGDVVFEITFEQIQGIEPLPPHEIVLRSEDTTYTLHVTDTDKYAGVNWYINGITGKGPSFMLKRANYSPGDYYLTVEVVTHDGKYYSQTITVKVQ